jgi:hypothetical protein
VALREDCCNKGHSDEVRELMEWLSRWRNTRFAPVVPKLWSWAPSRARGFLLGKQINRLKIGILFFRFGKFSEEFFWDVTPRDYCENQTFQRKVSPP